MLSSAARVVVVQSQYSPWTLSPLSSGRMGKGTFPIRQVERMRLLCCLVIDILNIRNWGGIKVKSGVEMHSG
jgi:hypothetical protein